MTDKQETPTERLLREAMSARAMQISAHDLRPAAPPTKRVRRLRPAFTVTVSMFALAAAVAGYFTLGGTPDVLRQEPAPAASASAPPTVSESPSPAPSPTPSPTPSPSATETPGIGAATSRPPATPYTFRNVKFQVPPGWRTVTEGPGADSMRVCVVAPDAPTSATQAFAGCVPYGVLVAVWNSADEVKAATWPIDQDLDASSGWSHQPYCSVWGNPHPIAEGAGYKRLGEPKRTVLAVNGRYASKTQWEVACDANERFTAQMWGFHKEQVFVVANGLRSDYQDDLESIVNSLDLSKHADPLKKGHANDIRVAIGAPTSVRQGDSEMVTFPVTWTNVSSTAYSAVEPVVAGDHVENPDVTKQPDGTLERKDGSSWTLLPSLRQGTGMDWATTGQSAAFALAPGQSRTLTYRMKLTTQDQMGGFGLTGAAFLTKGRETFTGIGTVHSTMGIH